MIYWILHTLATSTIHKLFDLLKVSFKRAVILKVIKENPSLPCGSSTNQKNRDERLGYK